MKSIVIATVIASIGLVGCVQKPGGATGQISDQTTSIQRDVATPSGDWVGRIDYTYGQDGNLRHASYEFRTFTGYDEGSEEFGSTRCIREYDVSEEGELILRSKVTTDLSTGESVEREFYEPEIIHWMTLAEAHRENDSEQSAAPNP